MILKTIHRDQVGDGGENPMTRELKLPDNMVGRPLVEEVVKFLDGWAVNDDLIFLVDGMEVKR